MFATLKPTGIILLGERMRPDAAEPWPDKDFAKSATAPVTADRRPRVEKWSRPARFVFIAGAAILCWAVPIAVVFFMLR